jgi:ribosomal protein L34E
MNLNCNNKKCQKISEAKLNTKTNEVICAECGQPISNISESMKRALKQAGQIIRANTKKAFMVWCKACNANREVILEEGDQTVCKDCHAPIKIQAAFKLAMQEAGVKLDKAETKEETEE